METTREISAGERIELSSQVIGLERQSRRACLMANGGMGPQGPLRVDGYTVGAPYLTGDAPHDGEMHPDGDELLYLVSGKVTVRLELDGGHRDVELVAGEALVVPQGVWHRIHLVEPGQLVHITPGPSGRHRPSRRGEVTEPPAPGADRRRLRRPTASTTVTPPPAHRGTSAGPR